MNESRRFIAFLSLLLCAALAAPAVAQSRKDKEEESKASYIIRDQRVAKKLTKVNELLELERQGEAKAILDGMNLSKLNPYPKALVYTTYAFLAAEEDDFEGAASNFKKALATEALPPSRALSIRFNLGQLQMMNNDWPGAIATIEAWFKDVEKPSPQAYYMLGVAYFQNDQKTKALKPAKTAVEISKRPRETWLQLLLSLYMEDERYKEAKPILVKLISNYSKKVYWIQLAAVLMELEQDNQSLAVQQLAYDQGLLTGDRELKRLSEMYLFQDLPWRSAALIGKELESGRVESNHKSWRLYANALLSARENAKAVAPLERAAELAETGDGYIQLSQVHIQNEDWEKADAALSNAFRKGQLKNPGQANLLLGIVAYQQKRWDRARGAMARASRDAKFGKIAVKWGEFIDREERAAVAKAEVDAAREAERERRAAEAAAAESEGGEAPATGSESAAQEANAEPPSAG